MLLGEGKPEQGLHAPPIQARAQHKQHLPRQAVGRLRLG
jgi:hypothetical protein